MVSVKVSRESKEYDGVNDRVEAESVTWDCRYSDHGETRDSVTLRCVGDARIPYD